MVHHRPTNRKFWWSIGPDSALQEGALFQQLGIVLLELPWNCGWMNRSGTGMRVDRTDWAKSPLQSKGRCVLKESTPKSNRWLNLPAFSLLTIEVAIMECVSYMEYPWISPFWDKPTSTLHSSASQSHAVRPDHCHSRQSDTSACGKGSGGSDMWHRSRNHPDASPSTWPLETLMQIYIQSRTSIWAIRNVIDNSISSGAQHDNWKSPINGYSNRKIIELNGLFSS